MSSRRLEGRCAIVSGGARGIGLATVRRFVAEGARVVAADVLGEGAQAVAEFGDSVRFEILDVSDPQAWSRVVDAAEAAFGPVNILVNNAGVTGGGSPLLAESLETYQRVIDVNQTGVFNGIRAVAPSMQRAGGGSIVNVSSIAGLVAWPGLGAYAASKFGVVGLTKTAAAEFGLLRIRVNAVHPGITNTAIIDQADGVRGQLDAAVAMTPMARIADPSEIASAILFFASDDGSFCTGASLAVDGGWTAL